MITLIEKLESHGSGQVRDPEHCYICGDDDYEDWNLIGFCDVCNLPVHAECYGLIDNFNKHTDFICNSCQALG